jgi:hypothetical protein
MHKLLMTGAVGLSICAVSLGAAIALGGAQANEGLFSIFSGEPACRAVAVNAPSSRILDWDGSDHITLATPANAIYSPGGDGKIHVTGDPGVIAHLRVNDGRIETDCHEGFFGRSRVHIVLPGVPVKRFHIAGSGDLTLQQLDQNRLKAEISGSGSIHADGKVDELDIKISGSGSSDFGKVAGRDAKVRISGSGDADIAPSQDANIHISGSGEVRLHSAPATTEEHISGSGTIRRI